MYGLLRVIGLLGLSLICLMIINKKNNSSQNQEITLNTLFSWEMFEGNGSVSHNDLGMCAE